MTEPRAVYMVSRPQRRPAKRSGRRQTAAEAGFPGCRAVPMTAAQLAALEDGPRFEYWDAEGGVAWTLRDGPTIVHEYPAHKLPALLERISDARGAAIVCGGAMTFYENGPTGERIRAMEADQTIYLDSARARALPSPTIVLGADAPPDVVLEVDHTTDVRRRKLREYERWRFPEVWVEVPPPWQGRRSRRRAGLTIHVLEGNGTSACYREAEASKAFPGWTAAEIHLALNEPERSDATWAALERVGCALCPEGPALADQSPLGRRLAQAHTAGLRQGRSEGEGSAKAEAVRAVLATRGIACSRSLLADARLATCAIDDAVAAALACESEAEFLAWLGAGNS